MLKKLINIFFRTKNGEYIVGQTPNGPIVIAGIFYFLRFLTQNESALIISDTGANLSMIYWAILEIFYGVNLFRRLIGLIVLLLIIF